MPNVSSALGTTQAYIPVIAAGQLAKAAGLSIRFASAAALQAAITAEKLNITNTSAIWSEGQILSDATMPPGVSRIWNATSPGDARRVLVGSVVVTLAADTNVVLPTTGVPGSGTGANGDVAVDVAAGAYYTKSGGAWAATGALYKGATGKLGASFVFGDVGKSVSVRADVAQVITKAQMDGFDATGTVASGSAVIEVKVNGTIITASAKPTLSSASTSTDSTLTGWTKSVAAGDLVTFTLVSASTIASVLLTLTTAK